VVWRCGPPRPGGCSTTVTFATQPQLVMQMIGAALGAGGPASWVAADEVYGDDADLRAGLQARGVGYVLAVGCNRHVAVNRARTRMRVDTIVAGLFRRWWHRMPAGIGAKGPRDYDSAAVAIGAESPLNNRVMLGSDCVAKRA